MYKFLPLALFLIIPFTLLSQILPKEGSKLNYRIVGFSFPSKQPTGSCKVQIAEGKFNNRDSFRRHIIVTRNCTTDRIVAEVPSFGKEYTWCVVSDKQSGVVLHHFSVTTSAEIDSATARLRIIKAPAHYKDAYVFIDCMQALFDMYGHPVWFLPDSNHKANPVDMKLSPWKTITFINGDKIEEIGYDGSLLWSGPNTGVVSEDTSEHYHHEFTRLANGHYMVMGSQDVKWQLPDYIPDTMGTYDIIRDSNNIFWQKLRFGTIIEYDTLGQIVWSWRSSSYYKSSDIYKRRTPNGKYKQNDVHQNSFFFDEKRKMLYMSFRNTSQILKIKYPEGTVMAAYGNDSSSDVFFSGQHSVNISKDGDIYLFNNNVVHASIPPQIVVAREPTTDYDTLKPVWVYDCSFDGLTESEMLYYDEKSEMRKRLATRNRPKTRYTSGGNVVELADGDMFASLNGPSSKLFIVTRDKNEIWSAIPEGKQPTDTEWHAIPTYRASIISNRKELEDLIWASER